MFLINSINRNMSFMTVKSLLRSIFSGLLGFDITTILLYIFAEGGSIKYEIFTNIILIIIILPFLIIYIKEKKKFEKVIEIFKNSKPDDFQAFFGIYIHRTLKVKSLYNIKSLNIKMNEVVPVYSIENRYINNWYGYFIKAESGDPILLKKVINKFIIDDIKEERKLKLKKIG